MTRKLNKSSIKVPAALAELALSPPGPELNDCVPAFAAKIENQFKFGFESGDFEIT